MAEEGEFPKVDGDELYASEVNEFKTNISELYDTTPKILEVYNGTELNVAHATITKSKEFTFYNLKNDYVKIFILGLFTDNADIVLECKEVEDEYEQLIIKSPGGGQQLYSFIYINKLTEGMKLNGVKYKITVKPQSASTYTSIVNVLWFENIN